MTAAPMPVPDSSSSPAASVVTPAAAESPPTIGTAVFHVERLPIGGWGIHPPPSRRRAVGGPRLARGMRREPGRPTAAASSIHPAPGVNPADAGRGSGEWHRLLGWPLLALLWLYRRLVSPVLPPACRYYPSCSRYAVQAVTLHGPIRGAWLSARRLLRCHPWAPGGPDPVPPRRRPVPGQVPR